MPISATFSQMKPVPSRNVVQIILEIPFEAADKVLEQLGGYPQPLKEKWVAVALLKDEPKQIAPPAEKPKRHLADMSLAQVAGIFCNDPKFWEFLNVKYYDSIVIDSEEAAAKLVRGFCNVDSRAKLDKHSECGEDFRRLWTAYDVFTGKQAEPR